MSSLIRQFIAERSPKPAAADVDEVLTEVLALAGEDPLKLARACVAARIHAEAQIELATELLALTLKPRGLHIPTRHQKVSHGEQQKRRSGKPRVESRLPDGVPTKLVGKLAYWRKVRARMNGTVMNNKEAAEAELKKWLHGYAPTQREIDDVAKRVSESERRQE